MNKIKISYKEVKIIMIVYDVNNWLQGPEMITQEVTYFQTSIININIVYNYYLRVDTSPTL